MAMLLSLADTPLRRFLSAVQLTLPGLAMLACLAGCTGKPGDLPIATDPSQTQAISVYVVNYPLQYFAERIGGEHVRVIFPAPTDQDPAFWRPAADTIAAYQQADLILLNGASYAKWTEIVTLPKSKIVETSAALADRYIEVEDAVTHSHGPGAQHAHIGTAFTTWLDCEFAIAQAKSIADAFSKLRPEHAADFQRGFQSLETDLNDLDAKLRAAVKDRSSQPIYFSHPVYQYLTRRYGLNAKSVHWEPESAPSSQMWDQFEASRSNHAATWMVWEGEPTRSSVDRLMELDVQSTVFDPCGNVPDSGDFMSVMHQNAANLASALRE